MVMETLSQFYGTVFVDDGAIKSAYNCTEHFPDMKESELLFFYWQILLWNHTS
jgi:hypothetical protein